MKVLQSADEDKSRVDEVSKTLAEIYMCYSLQSLRARVSIDFVRYQYFRDALRTHGATGDPTVEKSIMVFLTLGELDELIDGLKATRTMLQDAIDSEERRFAAEGHERLAEDEPS